VAVSTAPAKMQQANSVAITACRPRILAELSFMQNEDVKTTSLRAVLISELLVHILTLENSKIVSSSNFF
jgi:hypothetical protein